MLAVMLTPRDRLATQKRDAVGESGDVWFSVPYTSSLQCHAVTAFHTVGANYRGSRNQDSGAAPVDPSVVPDN